MRVCSDAEPRKQDEPVDNDASVEGAVVVITGASSGIGRAVARRMAKRGAKLVLAGRSEERLAGLVAELGASARHVTGDLTEPGEPGRLVEAALEAFAKIDILFANAGTYIAGPWPRATLMAGRSCWTRTSPPCSGWCTPPSGR